MTFVMVIAIFVLFSVSVPVGVAIGLSSVLGIVLFTKFPLMLLAQQAFISLDKFPLVAIPFFILAGNIMAAGGISSRLVEFAKSLVGGFRSGLAITCILTCLMFAAVSGSGIATTFAIGAILIPAMVRHGYPTRFAASLQATSAELGVIIPPSIPMILYGVSANVSIGELFIAGIGPGILVTSALIITVVIWCKIKDYGIVSEEPKVEISKSVRRAGLALLMPVIILGGIYGGIFTPTEASVVAVVYSLVVSMFLYKEMTTRDIAKCLHKTVIATSSIMIIIAMVGLFSFLLTREGIPNAIGTTITEVFQNKWTFLLAVNLVLFFIGMFLDAAPTIIVLAPILAPVAERFDIDPVQFGIIMVVNLALGMITPPFGVNLFAASSVANISVHKLIRPLLVFISVIITCLMVITYVPEVSLFLRDLVYR